MFTLSIETVTGRTFTLKADGATTTVGELKAMIAAQEGVPAEAQVLSWKGRTLGYAASSFLGLSKPEHDERTLSYYSIETDGESIQLVLNPYVLATLRESALEKPAISNVSISIALDVKEHYRTCCCNLRIVIICHVLCSEYARHHKVYLQLA